MLTIRAKCFKNEIKLFYLIYMRYNLTIAKAK